MKYALLGDIHSSVNDLEKVLAHIRMEAPDATLIGTGDIYECIISKKDITDHKFEQLDEVMLNPTGLSKNVQFPSIKGNQEERILLLTESDELLRKEIQKMPEKIELVNAQVIHGHQWKWGGTPWALLEAKVSRSITFYGHSHASALTVNGIKKEIKFGESYSLDGSEVLVNVGSVISNQEWVLYDTDKNTVVFKSAKS